MYGDSITSWKSGNTKIVKLSQSGESTAQKTGQVMITITLASGLQKRITVTIKSGSKKYVVKIVVLKTKTSGITLSKDKVTLEKGKMYTLKINVSSENSDEKITYKTFNKKVVTVTSKVKGIKTGTARITVKLGENLK